MKKPIKDLLWDLFQLQKFNRHNLTLNSLVVMSLLHKNEHMSVADIAEEMDFSERTILKIITPLRAKNSRLLLVIYNKTNEMFHLAPAGQNIADDLFGKPKKKT